MRYFLRIRWPFRFLSLALLLLASSALPGGTQVAKAAAGSVALVDLNTASRAELRALPGMGDVYVERIVRGRPYTAKTQLTQRGILPASAYAKIKDRVIARRR